MSEPHSFSTERLRLRPTSIEDAPLVNELFNSPKWLKYIGDRNIHSLEDAKEYIESKMWPQLKRLGFSSYTILRTSDDEKIGFCGLYDREGVEGVDIGFALLEKHEGNGYAYEACHKLKESAFKVFKLTELKAITTADNIASQKLLEKLGMKPIGNTSLPEDYEELLLYHITA